jgi:hypothetical protein
MAQQHTKRLGREHLPGLYSCFGVPDLTRKAGIQLNERVSLRRPFEILSSIQSRGLANAVPTGHAYRAIRGRCCVIEGSGPAHFPKSIHYLSRGKCCVPSLKSGNLVTSAVFKNWICPTVTPSSFNRRCPSAISVPSKF